MRCFLMRAGHFRYDPGLGGYVVNISKEKGRMCVYCSQIFYARRAELDVPCPHEHWPKVKLLITSGNSKPPTAKFPDHGHFI
jgi:hypothetical protein